MPAGGWDEEAAVAALERNLWSMWSVFGRGDGCTLVDTDELLRFEMPIPHIPYNSVMRSRLGDDADAVVDDIVASSRRRNVPLLWVVHPTATPADLPERLVRRGLVEVEVCPGMVADLTDVPAPEAAPPGVVVEQLGPQARGEFYELVAWRYSLPADVGAPLLSVMRNHGFGEPGCPTRAWVARQDGRVVSKVILHVHEGVAGIYGVATRSEARGLGLAGHLMRVALDAARRDGISRGVLHSTPMAISLYASLGFRAVADFRLYAEPGSGQL